MPKEILCHKSFTYLKSPVREKEFIKHAVDKHEKPVKSFKVN